MRDAADLSTERMVKIAEDVLRIEPTNEAEKSALDDVLFRLCEIESQLKLLHRDAYYTQAFPHKNDRYHSVRDLMNDLVRYADGELRTVQKLIGRYKQLLK